MQTRFLVDPVHYERMTVAELRAAFLVEDLFAPDEVRLVHWEAERTILGSVVPRRGPLTLDAPAELSAPFFATRREVGVVNLGGLGAVTVDGQTHGLGRRDGLYIGRGAREIVFASKREDDPGLFYLVSHPAHASLPSARVSQGEAETVRIGSQADASLRVLRRYIHARGVPSCQLVMGVTDIEEGSVWNSIPPHTHHRRTEVYLYFDLAPSAFALHVMGPPENTRHLVVRNLQAVLAPSWSMHFGVATGRYAFVWSMGGENQEFEDMQAVDVGRLR
ncbi:MAG: 5-dehydro-4-deoxy-D-glucuronate isomerase [Acidobacteria bacterium RBG_13_68_16]|nr:MAG: 5-dehydro-4-deoxy-D-glucuronate isomerase [Acidobacteria bacterium RBG_13_68_16]